MSYLFPLSRLVENLRRLSGIGAKSAQRMAFQILSWRQSDIVDFSEALREVSEKIMPCSECCGYTTVDSADGLCEICANPKRNRSLICVVSSIRELFAIERTNDYKGLYHVLGGLISPMDGLGPDDLNVKQLHARLASTSTPVAELILALSPSTEGEATTLYLSKAFRDKVPTIARLAFGLSVGSDIDQTDELTLSRAIEERKPC